MLDRWHLLGKQKQCQMVGLSVVYKQNVADLFKLLPNIQYLSFKYLYVKLKPIKKYTIFLNNSNRVLRFIRFFPGRPGHIS